MGALATGASGTNKAVVDARHISAEVIDEVARQEEMELIAVRRRTAGLPPRPAGRTVVVVDDGLATATMRAPSWQSGPRPARVVADAPVADRPT